MAKEDQRKNIKANKEVFEVFSERCKALDMTQNELLETLLQEEVERTTTLKVERGTTFHNLEKQMQREGD